MLRRAPIGEEAGPKVVPPPQNNVPLTSMEICSSELVGWSMGFLSVVHLTGEKYMKDFMKDLSLQNRRAR